MASEVQLNEEVATTVGTQRTRAKEKNLIHSRLVHRDDARSLSAQSAYCGWIRSGHVVVDPVAPRRNDDVVIVRHDAPRSYLQPASRICRPRFGGLGHKFTWGFLGPVDKTQKSW